MNQKNSGTSWEKMMRDWVGVFSRGSRIVDVGNPDRVIADAAPTLEEPVAIPVEPDGFALVDLCDLDLVADLEWKRLRTKNNNYAITNGRGPGKSGITYMHRLISCPHTHEVVDHANGNGLDNRRANLRLCSMGMNRGNAFADKDKKHSQYKGVSRGFYRIRWRYTATIKHKGKTFRKLFDDELAAARWYDDHAREIFGEYACLNFPREGERSALRLSA